MADADVPERHMNIVWRETWRGRVWRAIPCRIVEERDGVYALWHGDRTPAEIPVDAAGNRLRIPGDTEWELRREHSEGDSLGLVRLGSRWSLWHEFREGEFSYWYINFERDQQRTPVGIDFVDEKLDFVVDPDGSVRWKDEDELVEAARGGYLDEHDVRAQAASVLADPPWPTGWEDWRPDPSWPIPALPEGWDVVSGRAA
jgi:hypothetical protein